ncbi:sterol O-acyltransferase 1 isoform X1 [Vespula squamosa]|uniref:Sterol O-acyltransferase 1 isoform X1 n=1 Tax=Vespula squamosa TaxID=30214 RepID=A0ABD2B3K7_VESSQ
MITDDRWRLDLDMKCLFSFTFYITIETNMMISLALEIRSTNILLFDLLGIISPLKLSKESILLEKQFFERNSLLTDLFNTNKHVRTNKCWHEYHNMEFRKIFKCPIYLVFNDLSDTWNLHSVLYLGSQTSPFSAIM